MRVVMDEKSTRRYAASRVAIEKNVELVRARIA